jgi:hypothetical protein
MVEEEFRLPENGDVLVTEGGDPKTLFADWLMGNWASYADGYKKAADMLVERLEGNAPEDILILPIIFTYRHYLELKLKYLISALDVLSDTKMSANQFMTHNLTTLWAYVKDHLGCIRGKPLDKNMLASFDQMINELANLDPDSMHFRYAYDRDFNEMNIPKSLNLRHFKESMGILANGFTYIEVGMDYEREARAIDADFEAEMQSYMDF